MGWETPNINPQEKPEEKQKPFAMEEKPEKPRGAPAEYTEVEFTPEGAAISSPKTGEKPFQPKEKLPATAYEQLTDDEKKKVNEKVENYLSSLKGYSDTELQEERIMQYEKEAKETLAKRIESQDLKKAA